MKVKLDEVNSRFSNQRQLMAFLKKMHKNNLIDSFKHFFNKNITNKQLKTSQDHQIEKSVKEHKRYSSVGQAKQYQNKDSHWNTPILSGTKFQKSIYPTKKKQSQKQTNFIRLAETLKNNHEISLFHILNQPNGHSIKLQSFKNEEQRKSNSQEKSNILMSSIGKRWKTEKFGNEKYENSNLVKLKKVESMVTPHKNQINSEMKQKMTGRNLFKNQMKIIEKAYDSEKLYELLAEISGNRNKNNLRIYKEALRKVYLNRFGKEKITSFFDYEYIEDFGSQDKLMKDMVNLSHEEILLLVFLILDQNGDGLVCNHDIFLISTFSNKENPLINSDVYKIVRYAVDHFKQQAQKHQRKSLEDFISHQFLVHNQGITLQKYRMHVIREQKIKKNVEIQGSRLDIFGSFRKIISNSNSHQNQNIIKKQNNSQQSRTKSSSKKKTVRVTRNVHSHLFSLKVEKEEESQNILQKWLNNLLAGTYKHNQYQYTFRINFQRFKSEIFENCIPDIFYDILHVMSGLTVENKKYLPIFIEVAQREKKIIKKKDVLRLNFYAEKVKFLKNNCRLLTTQSFKKLSFQSLDESEIC